MKFQNFCVSKIYLKIIQAVSSERLENCLSLNQLHLTDILTDLRILSIGA